MTCPQIEELEAYVSGVLAPEERTSLDLHLRGCESCRSFLSEIAENSRTLEAVRSAFLEAGGEFDAQSPLPEIPGHEIIRTIHAGGQGIVYEALQASTKRRVAVKLLLHGRYADKRARHRFEREIDLAASLNHPGIVAVFDSGTTADGRLYLIMRYVEGEPLNPGEVARELEVKAALALFRKIAAAVAYAHQRGVIHRDLKPSNILIDAQGEPHLLDFGLAKTSKVPEAQQSLQTQAGEFVGTLAYAAPEQVSGAPAAVDVRSDVYALGVLLYEMLTGEHPYPVHGHLASIVRSITDFEAPRPSIRRRGIDDELDTIVLKALSKDVSRRYQSVGDLARDLERYAAGRPIEAKGDSAWYLLRKSLRRHRAPVAAAGLIVLALFAATVVSFSFWRGSEADRARALAALETADLEAKKSAAVNQFLLDMLAAANPARLGRAVTVREALDSAAATIDASFADQPPIEASVRQTLGITYRALGLYEQAELNFRESLKIRQSLAAEKHADTLAAMAALGLVLSDMGRYEEAEQWTRRALELQHDQLGEDNPATLASQHNLGLLHYRRGDRALAERIWEDAFSARLDALGEEHPDTLDSMHSLAWAYANRGELDRSLVLTSQLVEVRRRSRGEHHPLTLRTLSSAALLASSMGRYEQALAYLEEAYEPQRRLLGEGHIETLDTMDQLGWVYLEQGRYEEAEALQLQAVRLAREALGAGHPATLRMMNNLAINYDRRGQLDRAESLYREALTKRLDLLGADHPDTLASRNNLAIISYKQKRYEETEALWSEVLEVRSRTLGENHPDTLVVRQNMALVLIQLQRYDEAEHHLQYVLAERQDRLGPDHPQTLLTKHNLAFLRQSQGRSEEAVRLGEELYERRRAVLGPTHPETLTTLYSLTQAHVASGNAARARELLTVALLAVEAQLGVEHERAGQLRERLLRLDAESDGAGEQPGS